MNDMTLDPSFGLEQDDFNRAAAGIRVAQRGIVNDGLEQDPDDAAEAVGISDLTGARPQWVASNLDEYREQLRKQSAQELVLNNPDLVSYVQSHPLAASVSNDDWGNLDKFTRESSSGFFKSLADYTNPTPKVVSDWVDSIIKGADEGFSGGTAFNSGDEERRILNPQTNSFGTAGALAATATYGIADLAVKLGYGFAGGAMAGLQGLGFSGPESEGALADFGGATMGAHGHTPEEPIAPKPQTGLDVAKPYLMANEEPPTGLHPEIDTHKAGLNAEFLSKLEEDLANAATSTTRERSPDLFAKLTERMYGESSIAIHADAALKLYGDKPPAIDDGLLGWVPGIDTQLATARDTGADVTIPLKDWMAKVDPELAKAVRDDIRVWPGGVTAREAEALPKEPKQIIDEPLPSVRAGAGLEPKFSIGDRKLQLGLFDKTADEDAAGKPYEMHDYDINDENGQAVGKIRLVPGVDGKTLYVDYIGGKAGLWANSFGPALVRDLKAQLKGLYPDYEYLTGHRVTGARVGLAAAGEETPMPLPRVKLAADGDEKWTPADHQKLLDILQNGWEHSSEGSRMWVNRQDPAFYNQHQMALGQAAADEIAKLTGGRAEPQGVAAIHVQGQSLNQKIRGAYAPQYDSASKIFYDMLGPDPVGIGRHESIHMLKDYGMFTREEWGTLERAATDEGWLDRYGINGRYPNLGTAAKYEEAIAEGFREWAAEAEDVRPKTGIGAIFQKIWDFLDRIRQGMGKYLGREPTWEEVFQKTMSGEVGKREPGVPRQEGQFRFNQNEQGEVLGDSAIKVGDKIYSGPSHIVAMDRAYAAGHTEAEVDAAINNEQDGYLTSHGRFVDRVEAGRISQPNAPDMPTGGWAKLSVEDERKANIEGMQNLQAASIGLDKQSFKRIQDAIRKQADEDLAKATVLAEKQEAKRQSKEWKSNRVEMLKEVAPEIRQRPDVAADLFVGSGELYGQKIRQRITLDASKLTDEQKAALPDHYTSKSGVDPEQVAGLFGFSSGDELVESLAKTEAMKNVDGKRMRTEDWIRKTVQAETDRRMELRYGDAAREAMDSARDSALSKSSLNVHYEEYMAMAQKAGKTFYGKDIISDAAHNLLNAQTVGRLNSKRLFDQMGMHARNAEKAMAAGDWAEATVHMERQTLTHHLAAVAYEKEKEIAKFNKDAKVWGRYKYGKAASSMATDYANVIQQVLSQVGKKVQPTAEWLEREMKESGVGTDVKSFVNEKVGEGAIISPWEELYNPQMKFDFKDLSIEQFDRANEFLRTLVAAGRYEKKLFREGKAFDFEEKKAELIAGLEQQPDATKGGVAKGIRTVNSLMIQMETYIDKLDQWNPSGTWNQFLLEPLFTAEHVEMDRVREVTKEIQDITKLQFDNKEIPSIFVNPRNGERLVATRKSLWSAMLNQGTDSNREVFAKSWGLKPEQVRMWIDSHATKADWDGVQKIWDLFKKTGDWSDHEYRDMSDRAMKREPAVPVDTPHGKYDGGYYPIMHHPDFPGKSANLLGLSEKGLFGSGYSTGIVPGAGYRIERTGYVSPMALDLNQVASRLVEQIHDGAMRGAITQAAKILRDPDIKDALIEKLGHEVYDGMVKHLRRIASGAGPSADLSLSMQRVLAAGDYIRRNIVSNMIGLNLGTIEKHGPTAFVTSLSQLGAGKMLAAYKDIWTADETSGMLVRKSIYEKSALMRGRQRYWQDSIYGSVGDVHNDNTLMEKFLRFREWSQWAATQPVALSDALSAEPLWWGIYKDAKQAGHSEGDSVFMADKAVRKAHGAGGVVGQPLVVNQVSKWFTPMYNFYNSVLNKAVEGYWRAGQAQRDWKEGDLDKAKTNMKAAAVGGFVALVMPTIIHDIISPPKTEPDDSWEWRIMKYIVGPMASFIPGGGNVGEYLMGSSTPDVGLMTAAMKQAFDLSRDLTHKQVNSPAHNEKLIRDGGTFMGFLGVGAGRQLGAWAGGAYGVATGHEHVKGLLTPSMHDLVRFGTVRKGD